MQEGTLSLDGLLPETGALPGNVLAAACPTRQLLDRIADKWSLLLLLVLAPGPARFSELKRRVGGISQKMLSQTLRGLERDGLVDRRAVATVPVTVTYRITPLGASLVEAVRPMIDWAQTRVADVAQAQRRFDATPRD